MAETAGVPAGGRGGGRARSWRRRLDDRDYHDRPPSTASVRRPPCAAAWAWTQGQQAGPGPPGGARENAVVALGLLESLDERGLDPGRARLFVLDGSKALHKAVGQVFGSACGVQRCRNHKMRKGDRRICPRNSTTRPAPCCGPPGSWARRTVATIEQFASWVEKQHPDAAGSLREGLGDDVHRQGDRTTPALRRSGHDPSSTTRTRACAAARAALTRWRDGSMAVRWAAAAIPGRREELPQDHGLQRTSGSSRLHLDELGTPPVDGELAA